MTAERIIPVTPIALRYRRLRDADERTRLKEAEHFINYPLELGAEFAASVSHFEHYDNRDEDFFDKRPKVVGNEDATHTKDVVLRMQRLPHIQVVDRAQRRYLADEEAGLQDVAAEDLAFEYAHRELLLPRTTSPARWEDGRINRGGIRPDIVLANERDRTAVIAELKIDDDMDSFFALLQALVAVAHLATPAQYERLRRWVEQGRFPKAAEPRLDIYILYSGEALGSNKPAFTAAMESLVPALLAQDAVSRSVRRIAGLDLILGEGDALTAETRFAAERLEAPPRLAPAASV